MCQVRQRKVTSSSQIRVPIFLDLANQGSVPVIELPRFCRMTTARCHGARLAGGIQRRQTN
jgi:hypothetical protein